MKKSKVLIVEDDEWLAEQYKILLTKFGYGVKGATNNQTAIDAVDDFKPDAILLDILLVGTTAFNLLHELKSYKDTANIPIIVCSNLADNLDFKKLEPYGVRRVLDKTTMKPDDIIVALKAIL
jgi:DNA-binding response OmpR family regulator